MILVMAAYEDNVIVVIPGMDDGWDTRVIKAGLIISVTTGPLIG